MSRRGNGEGSIRCRADGRWEATISISGCRFWLQAKTQAEVRSELDDLKREHHLGTLVPPKRLTLAEFLDQWIKAGSIDWRPKTRWGYERIVATYWKPELGHVQLQKLSAPMLSSCYAKWRPGRSGGTLLNIHRCIHRALVVAVRWGFVSRNVADQVEPPKGHRKRPELWSTEQALHFLDSIRGSRWHALWAVLMGTGCRLGEALALRWTDLDLDKGIVRISRSRVWAGMTPVDGDPKTISGLRVLALPPFTTSALRQAHRESEYVAPFTPWQMSHAFKTACRRAELPFIRRHDLRHLAASMLLGQGLSLPAVAQRLGHASPAITATICSHALHVAWLTRSRRLVRDYERNPEYSEAWVHLASRHRMVKHLAPDRSLPVPYQRRAVA